MSSCLSSCKVAFLLQRPLFPGSPLLYFDVLVTPWKVCLLQSSEGLSTLPKVSGQNFSSGKMQMKPSTRLCRKTCKSWNLDLSEESETLPPAFCAPNSQSFNDKPTLPLSLCLLSASSLPSPDIRCSDLKRVHRDPDRSSYFSM